MSVGAKHVWSLLLLGIILMPSQSILDSHRRTHKRHATCEHHLRSHHDSPKERARVLRRAERRRQRAEERAPRLAEERLALASLEGVDVEDVRAAADPLDDPSDMKRKRKGKVNSRCLLPERPESVREAGVFLAMLREHLTTQSARLESDPDPLPHFGSGPCHDFPRAREGTILPSSVFATVA